MTPNARAYLAPRTNDNNSIWIAVSAAAESPPFGCIPSSVSSWFYPLLKANRLKVIGSMFLQAEPNQAKVGLSIVVDRTHIQSHPINDHREFALWQQMADFLKRPVSAILPNTTMTAELQRGTPAFPQQTPTQAPVESRRKRTYNYDQRANEDAAESDEIKSLLETLHSKKMAEMEPGEDLMLQLRPYQKQALAWMVAREQSPEEREAEMAKQQELARQTLPSGWKEFSTTAGKKYYFNEVTKETTWSHPNDPTNFPDMAATPGKVKGGILADEMGMGKTIEVLSVILTNKFDPIYFEHAEEVPCKATLIVCPLSVLQQWHEEITNHTPPGKYHVYLYHGTNRTRNPEELMTYDIVLTTYQTLAAELPSEKKEKRETAKDKDKTEPEPKRVKREEKPPQVAALLEVPWFRVVLDEAHTIKDKNTRTAKAAYRLKADRRWCVTGTPIQNKLEDVFSLFMFLQAEPYGQYQWWTEVIMKPIRARDEKGMKLLQTILEGVLLRRTKNQKNEDNAPIVSLPPKVIELRRDILRADENAYYQTLWAKAQNRFRELSAEDRVMQNYAHILELLLRLRQACNHQLLVTKNTARKVNPASKLNEFLTQDPNGPLASKILHKYNGELGELEKRLKELLTDGYEDLDCVLCLEPLDNPMLAPCSHLFCKQCMDRHLEEASGSNPCPICQKGPSLTVNTLIVLPKLEHENLVDNGHWTTSTKIDALMQELAMMQESSEVAKCIIFSQWTTMLDLLETPLTLAGFKFVRLDGSMSQPQRNKAIQQFRGDTKVKIFLVSMKAGGLGLNLVHGNHVFMLDPWWNPATENQAIDRVHRLGQLRPVRVVKFIIKDSIEERILELCEKKKKLAQGALLRGNEVRQIRLEELKLLFRD